MRRIFNDVYDSTATRLHTANIPVNIRTARTGFAGRALSLVDTFVDKFAGTQADIVVVAAVADTAADTAAGTGADTAETEPVTPVEQY